MSLISFVTGTGADKRRMRMPVQLNEVRQLFNENEVGNLIRVN